VHSNSRPDVAKLRKGEKAICVAVPQGNVGVIPLGCFSNANGDGPDGWEPDGPL
jgi:hypothetical protein